MTSTTETPAGQVEYRAAFTTSSGDLFEVTATRAGVVISPAPRPGAPLDAEDVTAAWRLLSEAGQWLRRTQRRERDERAGQDWARYGLDFPEWTSKEAQR